MLYWSSFKPFIGHVVLYWCLMKFFIICSYLLKNYVEGRTVVPDILCNNIIKFDLLHKYAFEKLHVDAVATGHFVRTTCGNYLEEGDPKSCFFFFFKDFQLLLLTKEDLIFFCFLSLTCFTISKEKRSAKFISRIALSSNASHPEVLLILVL